ncbi:hypothetical protein BDA96_05G242500 [Sorghum bicolor]|uniref:Uncharacterized protein n=2 Tax=Sorghum bicolor TaxID=4558 RepID=A0A921R096_SORBI|nr:hypothetical protein BDA96_05G242500 [Sorghum bicolor]KXG29193.1 hypothetical protein SORBI_3005G225000 [Sorghum bicolor]
MAVNSNWTKTFVSLTTCFFVVVVIISPSCQAKGVVPPGLRPPFCFPYDPQYCTPFHCGKVCQEYNFPAKNGGFCDKSVKPWKCCCPY